MKIPMLWTYDLYARVVADPAMAFSEVCKGVEACYTGLYNAHTGVIQREEEQPPCNVSPETNSAPVLA